MSSTHNLQVGLLQKDVGDLETLRDVEDYNSHFRTHPYFSFSIFPFNAYWIIPPFSQNTINYRYTSLPTFFFLLCLLLLFGTT